MRWLRRFVRFVGWIMSPDKLDSDAEDPYDRLAESGPRWLFVRERLPEPPPPPQRLPVATGWWRFFLAPEPLDDAGSESAPGPRAQVRSFLREILRREALGAPEAGEESTAGTVGFLRGLLARERLEPPDSCAEGTARSFVSWLLAREAIEEDGGTQSLRGPMSRQC